MHWAHTCHAEWSLNFILWRVHIWGAPRDAPRETPEATPSRRTLIDIVNSRKRETLPASATAGAVGAIPPAANMETPMKSRLKAWLKAHHRIAKVAHGADHMAHCAYFGAAALGMHELYGYAAGFLLVVFVINLALGSGGEA